MAKDAHDREDLLRDATGYVSRWEFRIPGVDHDLFSGFRAEDAWSLYWGQDEVIQFNVQRELRRAFWRGQLLAAYGRKLHWLRRQPTSSVRLTRDPLGTEEQSEFLSLWQSRLHQLVEALSNKTFRTLGQVATDRDAASLTEQWLRAWDDRHLALALHPGIGRKR